MLQMQVSRRLLLAVVSLFVATGCGPGDAPVDEPVNSFYEDLTALFRRAIGVKPEEHPFHEAMEQGEVAGPTLGRGMHRIGG